MPDRLEVGLSKDEGSFAGGGLSEQLVEVIRTAP